LIRLQFESSLYASVSQSHHSCKQVENSGERVPEVFAKIIRGSRLSRKNEKWGPPILGFIAFL
jgi:hypothetical protein